jgi:SAM-dependent methyltransferase
LNPENDLVVITTISAGEQVSNQLEQLGFYRDYNYFEVMHRFDYLHPFEVVDFYKKYVGRFEGLDILHVGPGGHLGVELLLHTLAAKSVCSVEYDSFRLKYPDVTPARDFYEGLSKTSKERWNKDLFACGLLINEGRRCYIGRDKIRFLYPCSITALPFADMTFDLVLHHAVFEHVLAPEKGYKEIFRVLKRGGITVGLVDPQDHRTFSSFKEYYPLKFLEYSRQEWYEIARSVNFHNQITTPEHRDMIISQGFAINAWEIEMQMDISREIWQKFDPMFRVFDQNELGILRFAFSASKS